MAAPDKIIGNLHTRESFKMYQKPQVFSSNLLLGPKGIRMPPRLHNYYFLGSKVFRLAPIRSLFKKYTGRRPGIPAKPDKKVLFAYTAIIEKASKTQNVLKQFALLAPRALDCPHDNTIIISLGPRSFDWPQ